VVPVAISVDRTVALVLVGLVVAVPHAEFEDGIGDTSE
jgi:hypothetical protein